MHSERHSDVVGVLGTVAGDARSLHDEVLGEELAEALDIGELVGVDVVIVELLEDRQIFGGPLGVSSILVPSLCGSAFAAGRLSFRCRELGADVQGCPVPSGYWIRRAVRHVFARSSTSFGRPPTAGSTQGHRWPLVTPGCWESTRSACSGLFAIKVCTIEHRMVTVLPCARTSSRTCRISSVAMPCLRKSGNTEVTSNASRSSPARLYGSPAISRSPTMAS